MLRTTPTLGALMTVALTLSTASAQPQDGPPPDAQPPDAQPPEPGPSANPSPAPKPDAQSDATEPEAPVDDRDLQPEDGLPKPDPADLRSGHVLISLGGGLWVPSNPYTPRIGDFGRLDAGGTVHADVGLGLTRHFVLSVTGGYSRIVGGDCDGCAADSIDAGLRATGIIAQGFGFEPWASYGIGYRYTSLSLGDAPLGGVAPEAIDGDYHALDFMRLQVGGTYFPAASFGLGPYLGADVGFRDFSSPTFYGAFHAGFRVTFDPLRIGATAVPGQTTASR